MNRDVEIEGREIARCRRAGHRDARVKCYHRDFHATELERLQALLQRSVKILGDLEPHILRSRQVSSLLVLVGKLETVERAEWSTVG